MAPRKGFSPFTRVISDELTRERKWYVLTPAVCGTSPAQYFRKSAVVQSFRDEFKMLKRDTLRLTNETVFDGKAVSDVEVVVSSFGLLAVLFRQQASKSCFLKDHTFGRLKMFLNDLDFSAVLPDEPANIDVPIQMSVPAATPQANVKRPRVARKLSMPGQTPVSKQKGNDEATLPATPPQNSSKRPAPHKPSPNLKEISENADIDTPEKKLLITKRGQRLIGELNALCDERRESLSTILSYLCAFGDQEATAVITDVIEDVSSKKGVKRAMEDLAGEETMEKFVESLRVPDWVLLYFKTRARISGQTWQAVINITRLGRTGVSFFYLFIF